MKFFAMVLLFIISSCRGASPESSNYHRIANSANKQIRSEIPIMDDGAGAMIPNKIHAYSTIFHHDGPIPIELARCYALRITEVVLARFNSDSNIQEYLENRPFTIKNVSFSIFSNSRKNVQAPEGYTDFVSFAFGRLSYDRFDISADKSIEIFAETYEEALLKCPSFQ